MRLAWVKLNGVRRFVEPQKLVVDGKLTALIGPNEAGKTTVLEALELLTDPDLLGVRGRRHRSHGARRS